MSCNLIFREPTRDRYELLVCDVGLHSDLFRIIGVYRAPNCDVAGSLQLAKAISDFCSCCFPSIVLGGSNPKDLCSTNLRRISAVFHDLFESHGFEQLVSRGDAMLDLVLFNKKSFVEEMCWSTLGE